MIIREYEDGDEVNFLKLDTLIEEHPWNRRDINNWYWKYKGNNPFGNPICIYCYLKKEIIGHFGLLPLDYFFDGNLIKGANSIAMMVRQDFQNKGLMKYIGDKLFETSDKFVDFTYGIPNNRSYELHKNFFNYEDWMKLNFYSCPIENFQNKFSDEYKSFMINNFDIEYDNFWQSIFKQDLFILNKNSNFMNWRYSERPDHKYHIFKFTKKNIIKGYYILKIYNENKLLKGHIMDILYDKRDIETLNEIFLQSINFFKSNNVNEIFFYSNRIKDIEKKYYNQLNCNYKRNLIIRRHSKNKTLLDNILPMEDKTNFSMGDSLEIF